ncbi:hypothetical protein [Salinibacter ruber]|uniref:hypothetical protein n=1 Tax=Salinibacter ruber TaxID=146919 RepID=UPI002167DBFF|nr:hypothetical protein [Salinibacter ruber]MCS4038733.1 hypothetical protein [Salinibacter ruber]
MQNVVHHFASALKKADNGRPVEGSYDPGIGPHPEDKAVELALDQLKESLPQHYSGASPRTYPSSGRECDLVIPEEWAIEVKLARPYRDNGDVSPYWVKKVLSPYPDDYPGSRSAVGDCLKLARSDFDERTALMVVGYEHDPPKIEVGTAIKSLELIVEEVQDVRLGPREESTAQDLVHDVFEQSTVYGWEVEP